MAMYSQDMRCPYCGDDMLDFAEWGGDEVCIECADCGATIRWTLIEIPVAIPTPMRAPTSQAYIMGADGCATCKHADGESCDYVEKPERRAELGCEEEIEIPF
jgi:hypothetical protein